MILWDGHVAAYIEESLQKCHEQRVHIYYYVLNVGILLVFVLFGSVYLYYAFTTKLTPEQLYERRMQDQAYVLHQIRRYNEEEQKLETLTELPLLARRRGEEQQELRPVLYA